MKKRSLVIGLMLACAVALGACGGKETANQSTTADTQTAGNATEVATETEEQAPTQPVISEDEIPDGMVISDLSGEFIDASLENQRPIAVMVDNDKRALPHYGLNEADIIYEMINSLHNNRVTRMMAMYKDWDEVKQIGNVRSARATNCKLAMEWNAILCHDGGPFYINDYVALPSLDNLSGGFSRIPNGKSREFTEYVTAGEVAKRLTANNIEREYNNYYEGTHFLWSNEVDLDDAEEATYIAPPFPNNQPTLEYDADEQVYYYSEHGGPHIDPANDNEQLSFKNVILQEADMYTHKLGDGTMDQNGYMYYEIENSSGKGYYAVNGEIIPITWKKGDYTSPTQYFDANGNELVLNVGNTYIAIIPSDAWNELEYK